MSKEQSSEINADEVAKKLIQTLIELAMKGAHVELHDVQIVAKKIELLPARPSPKQEKK